MPRNPRSLVLTNGYHDKAIQLARAATRASQETLASIDPADADGSWDALVASASRLIAIGQERSQALADGYFLSLGRLEMGKVVEIAPSRENNVGFTVDGRPVPDVLVASRARFFERLAGGRSLQDAVDVARTEIGRVAFYEVHDAGQRELIHQIDLSDAARGGRVKSRGTCAACLAQDDGGVRAGLRGEIARRGGWPPFHPECVCIGEAVFDVEETVERETGVDRFLNLEISAQDEILGPVRSSLVRAELAEMSELVQVERFQEWSPALTEAAVGSLPVVGVLARQAREVAQRVAELPELAIVRDAASLQDASLASHIAEHSKEWERAVRAANVDVSELGSFIASRAA